MPEVKKRFSVGRVCTAGVNDPDFSGKFSLMPGCGKYAKWLQDGNKIAGTFAMQRGTNVQNRIYDYIGGEGDVPESWKGIIGDVRQYIDIEAEVKATIKGVPVPIYGKADLVTSNAVIDIKAAIPRNWHQLQVSIYAYILGKKNAALLYIDNATQIATLVPSEVTVTDETFRRAWANLEAEKYPLKPVEHCDYCPLRKECPLFSGSNASVDDYLALKTDLESCEVELKGVSAPLREAIDELKSKMSDIEPMIKALDEKIYRSHYGTVSVKSREVWKIPDVNELLKKYPQLANSALYDVKVKKAEYKKVATAAGETPGTEIGLRVSLKTEEEPSK